MTETTDALVLDLVEWIAREPRLYSEVIEAWRTSCPRLTIWEDAVDRGYVARQPVAGLGVRVAITEGGAKFLREHGRRDFTLPCRPWSLARGPAARPDPGETIAPCRG
jgi:hypothetical protein